MNAPQLDPFASDFDWLKALEYLSAQDEKPSLGIAYNLDVAAGAWPTCACGKLCQALPRTRSGAPEDSELFLLGGGFSVAVGNENWQGALKIFKKIEQRSAMLLVKMRDVGC